MTAYPPAFWVNVLLMCVAGWLWLARRKVDR